MKWKPAIDKEGIAQPAIESAPYRISKANMGGGTFRYCLHHNDTMVFADNAEELKGVANEQMQALHAQPQRV